MVPETSRVRDQLIAQASKSLVPRPGPAVESRAIPSSRAWRRTVRLSACSMLMDSRVALPCLMLLKASSGMRSFKDIRH